MLVAARSSQFHQGSKLLPLTDRIFVSQSTKQLFKVSQFERSACFNGNYLSYPRLLTFTIYDPIYLAIDKCWALQPAAPVPLSSLLDETDIHLLPYLEASFNKICDIVRRGETSYYKPSLQKIMSVVTAKYNRMMQVCKDKGISVRKPGLQTKDSAVTMSPIVEGILKQDLDDFFVNELKQRLELNKPISKEVNNPIIDEYVEQPENKRKKKQPVRSETKREKEMRHEKMNNMSLTSFFKPTPKKDNPQ